MTTEIKYKDVEDAAYEDAQKLAPNATHSSAGATVSRPGAYDRSIVDAVNALCDVICAEDVNVGETAEDALDFLAALLGGGGGGGGDDPQPYSERTDIYLLFTGGGGAYDNPDFSFSNNVMSVNAMYPSPGGSGTEEEIEVVGPFYGHIGDDPTTSTFAIMKNVPVGSVLLCSLASPPQYTVEEFSIRVNDGYSKFEQIGNTWPNVTSGDPNDHGFVVPPKYDCEIEIAEVADGPFEEVDPAVYGTIYIEPWIG